jgi:hypothetical protein
MTSQAKSSMNHNVEKRVIHIEKLACVVSAMCSFAYLMMFINLTRAPASSGNQSETANNFAKSG